jgi:hypothetical protein
MEKAKRYVSVLLVNQQKSPKFNRTSVLVNIGKAIIIRDNKFSIWLQSDRLTVPSEIPEVYVYQK